MQRDLHPGLRVWLVCQILRKNQEVSGDFRGKRGVRECYFGGSVWSSNVAPQPGPGQVADNGSLFGVARKLRTESINRVQAVRQTPSGVRSENKNESPSFSPAGHPPAAGGLSTWTRIPPPDAFAAVPEAFFERDSG